MYFDYKERKWVAEAIINGRKYSTETAKRIVWKNNQIYPDNWGAIYRKTTGEFFFVGSFGISQYPNCWENAWNIEHKHLDMLERTKRQIMPLTIDEAKMAIEEWCSASEYEGLFGTVDE
jgi:hypothetical protein